MACAIEQSWLGISKPHQPAEGIGCSLVGLHQTSLVTISLHLLNRLVWCGSIGVLPDWSGEKVKVISNQTSLAGKVFWSYQTEQTESIESKDKVW